jgi:hypothetical protein
MKVSDDSFQIQALPYDVETGEKFEPEEMPVARVLEGGAPVSFRGADGETLGHMPARIVRETDAITVAQEARSQCVRCKHFDQQAFRDWLNSVNGRQFKVSILDGLATQYGTTVDNPQLIHQLNFLGLCRIYTEIDRDVAVTRPDNSCAGASVDAPLGLFEPVTSGDEKISTAIYDSILKLAKGE